MPGARNLKAAVFLDRDGVIIENRADYIRSWGDVEIFPQALEALARAAAGPTPVVVVTNQSPVGRGLITLDTAEAINRRLLAEIEHRGGRVDAVYMCPHAPSEGCACRKPLPGMLLQAAADLQIDLGRSAFVGDALTDLQAGQAAGIPDLALVRTGRGRSQEAAVRAAGIPGVRICATLQEALGILLPRS